MLILSSITLAATLISQAQPEAKKPAIASTTSAADHGNVTANPRKKVVEATEIARQASHGLPITLDGAVIRGPLDLRYMVIEKQMSLKNCDFENEPDFSYATFKRHLELDGSTFRKGVNFQSMTVDLNASLNRTKFLSGKAVFTSLQVLGNLLVTGASFANGVNLKAEGMHVEKDANFTNTEFGGDVDISGMQAHSDLYLNQAKFSMISNLSAAKISGSLFFDNAQFFGPAGFGGMQVAYNVRGTDAVFKDGANFSEVQVKSFLDLTGAHFVGVKAPAKFRKATIVAGGFFDGVEFAGGAAFDGAHFNTDASFDKAVFDGDVSFDRAHFDQGAHFETCVFKRKVSFQEASFSLLDLSPDGMVVTKEPQLGKMVEKKIAQFGGPVELSGCTYNRIHVAWQSLLRKTDGMSRLVGIDRQPYFQLQKTYAASGDDDDANQVLLEWHRVKRQDSFRTSKLDWLIDCVPWLTSNYGVAPGRLLEISVFLLFFGMLIFSRPGAVLKCGSTGGSETEVAAKKIRLRHWDAAAVSLHLFLPIEVPFGSQWAPVSDPVALRSLPRDRGMILLKIRPSTCATFLKICGYILVPLEIVVLNGLLNPGL